MVVMAKRPSSADVIAANVRRLMKHLNLSQAELGRKAGVAQTLLSGLLSPDGASKNPTSSTVDKLADAFKITPWKLLVEDITLDSLLDQEVERLVLAFATVPPEGRLTILRVADAEVRYAQAPATVPIKDTGT